MEAAFLVALHQTHFFLPRQPSRGLQACSKTLLVAAEAGRRSDGNVVEALGGQVDRKGFGGVGDVRQGH